MPERRVRYLSFVSHELKNPLSTALWSVEMLARMTPEERAGERGERLTVLSARALRRMRRLVEDFFAYERVLLGEPRPNPERLELSAVVARAVEAAGPWAKEKNVGISAEVAPRAVLGDAELLTRAFVALVEYEVSRGDGDVRLVSVADGVRVTRAGATLTLSTPEDSETGDATGLALAPTYAKAAFEACGFLLVEDGGGLLVRVTPLAE